jgi:hypothetical protein
MARIVRAAPIALGIALVVPASAAAAGSLVALGDSYSSGEGAPPFVRPTNTAGNSCHRSSLAWPALVATSTGRPFASFACSGAETAEVVRSDSGRNEAERQVAQRERLRKVTAPELVTVTIGGNDVGSSRCFGLVSSGFVHATRRSERAEAMSSTSASPRWSRIYPAFIGGSDQPPRPHGCWWWAIRVSSPGARCCLTAQR